MQQTSPFAVLFAAGALAAVLASSPAAAAGWEPAFAGGVSAQVYVPASTSPIGSGRSLLLVLHGCTQTGASLQQHGDFETAAEEAGMVVVLPTVPNGGKYAGCWDYYGAAHARTGRDDGPLLELTSAVVDDASLEIDPHQVYVAGLSSGAGEAMVLACLAPDVFAGVGIAAGPTVGTEASQIALVSTSLAAASELCRTLAGSAAASFDTQLASIVYGDGDYIVAQGYGDLNAGVFADIYGSGAQLAESSFTVADLPGYMPAGDGALWSDEHGPRVSRIRASGMGHAWPAGTGVGTELSFVASEGVAYARYLGGFFSSNSLRATTEASSGAGGGTDGDGGGAADDEPGRARGRDDGGCAATPARAPGGDTAAVCALAALLALARRRKR